jgi:RNA polymerase sigma-70 factor (ECF subfamily)
MPEFPETRESLIARVRDPSNRAASDQFEQLYRPVIFRIARAKGLRHSDALDLVQQVLMSVSSAIGRYEKHPDGMRFRNWLSRVTRNAILKALSRGPRDLATGGTDILNVLHEVPADDSTDALWRSNHVASSGRQRFGSHAIPARSPGSGRDHS